MMHIHDQKNKKISALGCGGGASERRGERERERGENEQGEREGIWGTH